MILLQFFHLESLEDTKNDSHCIIATAATTGMRLIKHKQKKKSWILKHFSVSPELSRNISNSHPSLIAPNNATRGTERSQAKFPPRLDQLKLVSIRLFIQLPTKSKRVLFSEIGHPYQVYLGAHTYFSWPYSSITESYGCNTVLLNISCEILEICSVHTPFRERKVCTFNISHLWNKLSRSSTNLSVTHWHLSQFWFFSSSLYQSAGPLNPLGPSQERPIPMKRDYHWRESRRRMKRHAFLH